MNRASENSSRSDNKPGAAVVAPASAATWVRAKRAPRRKRVDPASTLQLGAITLASNRHA